MKIGILADTHDELERTRLAVRILLDSGAERLFHCGDLASPPIVEALADSTSYFVLGNHDSDVVPMLQSAADEHGVTCLGWHGQVTLAGKTIALAHGHMRTDIRQALAGEPDYLLSGHCHYRDDRKVGPTRRIVPGALHRADSYSVALLDLATDALDYIDIPDR